jgi:hypothetical protein
MNASEKLDDKKREAKRLALEKDRKAAKRIIQYMYFYFAVLTVLSLSSYVLDSVFHKVEHSNFGQDYFSPFEGLGFFMFIGFWIFPLSFFYNFIININQPVNIGLRILICIAFLALAFYLIEHNYNFGYYIGKYRQIKNVITVLISSVLIELIRDRVVKRRIRKKTEAAEWKAMQ